MSMILSSFDYLLAIGINIAIERDHITLYAWNATTYQAYRPDHLDPDEGLD